jgi:hypothetical protein
MVESQGLIPWLNQEMDNSSRISITGHRGLAGSATWRLRRDGCSNLILSSFRRRVRFGLEEDIADISRSRRSPPSVAA